MVTCPIVVSSRSPHHHYHHVIVNSLPCHPCRLIVTLLSPPICPHRHHLVATTLSSHRYALITDATSSSSHHHLAVMSQSPPCHVLCIGTSSSHHCRLVVRSSPLPSCRHHIAALPSCRRGRHPHFDLSPSQVTVIVLMLADFGHDQLQYTINCSHGHFGPRRCPASPGQQAA